MTKDFKIIDVSEIKNNVFELIADDWMLITAGTLQKYNTMTANWGGLGYLWNMDVSFSFIRPQRYTFGFVENARNFTFSFFDEKYREVLDFCGSASGRNVDKAKECGLHPFEISEGVISFAEARLIIVNRKIYFDDINPENFLDKMILKNYTAKDYHRMYIGEVTKCLLEKS